ncbi:MAG: OmpA family protein [Bacteroidota bacterium]
MRRSYFILCLASFFTLVQYSSLRSQTSENPWMAGLSASFLDYLGPIDGDYLQYKEFSPGITIGAHAYVTQWLNLSLNSSFVPEVRNYPNTSETDFLRTSLIDVNALMQFKSNGTFFKEDAFWAPYISTGFGLNSASNNLRLYVPGALGMRFRISKNLNFNIESMYKLALKTEDFQHIAHSAGFVFALPTEPKRKPTPEPEEPKEEPKEKPPIASADNPYKDSDLDGIPDKDDRCPDVKGLIMNLGCPPEDDQSDAGEVPVEESYTDNTTEEIPTQSYDNYVDNDNTSFSGSINQEDVDFLQQAMNNIFFYSGSHDLKSESYSTLDEVANILNKYPNYGLQVLGHTDNMGTYKSNQILSVMRAFEVKYYLVHKKGIPIARITSNGYNSANPIADNSTSEGREANRRVELKLISPEELTVPRVF